MEDNNIIPDPYIDFFGDIPVSDQNKPIYGCNEVSCMYLIHKSVNENVLYDKNYPYSSYRKYTVEEFACSTEYVSFLKENSLLKAKNDGVLIKNHSPHLYFKKYYLKNAVKLTMNNVIDIMSSYPFASFDFFGTLVVELSKLEHRLEKKYGFSNKEAKEFSFTLDSNLTSLNKKLNLYNINKDTGFSAFTKPIVDNVKIFNLISASKIILSDCVEPIYEIKMDLKNKPEYLLSFELGMTKANGNLYSRLPSKCIHFGDNYLVDGIMANLNNIDTIVFDDTGFYLSKC